MQWVCDVPVPVTLSAPATDTGGWCQPASVILNKSVVKANVTWPLFLLDPLIIGLLAPTPL